MSRARDDRMSESTLGNLVADSLLSTASPAQLSGAEIGMVNPGGLRAETTSLTGAVHSSARAAMAAERCRHRAEPPVPRPRPVEECQLHLRRHPAGGRPHHEHRGERCTDRPGEVYRIGTFTSSREAATTSGHSRPEPTRTTRVSSTGAPGSATSPLTARCRRASPAAGRSSTDVPMTTLQRG